MPEPFIGEIRMFGGHFAPRGWALCNGQSLPIPQNTALFSLLGVTYGGDGKTHFRLPNLMGRAPMHQGQGPGLSERILGEPGGETTVTLTSEQMPAHNHPAGCDKNSSGTASPSNAVWGKGGRGAQKAYGANPDTAMGADALQEVGGGQPHNNMQPYLGIHFIIALEGVFPSRT